MTKVQELLADGWEVMVSPLAMEGHPFAATDGTKDGKPIMVFHPLDYNYAAEPNFWDAHEKNMAYIQNRIDKRAKEALRRLDKMVYDFEHQHDPRLITFLYGTEVHENPDGSFTFFAKGGEGPAMAFEQFPHPDLFTELSESALEASKAMNDYVAYFEEGDR